MLREWDNPGHLEIWFDLAHSWTPALSEDLLPTAPSVLQLAPRTDYSSWAVYERQAHAAGLHVNESLQQAIHSMQPLEMAEKWSARNFEAIFALKSS